MLVFRCAWDVEPSYIYLAEQLHNNRYVQDVRPGISKSTYAFSRASSDAGSVLDSVSSTPRGRGPTRLQHHHELQAVASRLQHVQSSGAPCSQHGPTRNPRTAAASVYDDCSDTASWADEHVSCKTRLDLVRINNSSFTDCLSVFRCSLTGGSNMQQTLLSATLRASKL